LFGSSRRIFARPTIKRHVPSLAAMKIS